MNTCGKEPVWITADGRELTVKEMTHEHLTNARNCLAKRVGVLKEIVDHCFSYYPNCQGEMSQYYADAEWDRNIDQAQSRLQHTEEWIKRFNDEIAYRHPKSRVDRNRFSKKDSLSNIKAELYGLAKSQDYGSHSTRKWLFCLITRLENLIGE